MNKHIGPAALSVCLAALLSGPSALALEIGKSYQYNQQGEAVCAPAGYVCRRVLYGEELGIGSFKNPRDMAVDEQERLYIADTGNNRIVVLHRDLTLDRIIDAVVTPDGEKQALTGPEGLWTAGDLLYIGDTGAGRVVAVDADGVIRRTLLKPQTDLLTDDAEFKPSKLAVNDTGTVYVAASGIYQGLLQYDDTDAFLGFFGANKIEVTAGVLIRNFWKNLFSDEQREGMVRTGPTEYANVFMDDQGMIFTVTATVSTGQVRQLNAAGENIRKYPGQDAGFLQTGYDRSNYGDQEVDYQKGLTIASRMTDVQVDADGILSVLDNQRGRVFQYDKEQNPLCIFGGRGEQQGFFKNATALEKLGSEYLIADADKNSLTVFAPVPYMETVRLALAAYDAGDYEKSAALWEETLRQNGSLTVAYRGVGRARLQQGRYDEAMACLENGGDRYFYSLAVQQVRRQFTRANLWWLLPAAAAAVAAFVWLVKRIKRAILRSAKKEGRRT